MNFDTAYKNIYVQSATLNGKNYTRNWIGHEFFTQGGTLELVLGSSESSWGTRSEDRPPSMSDGTGVSARDVDVDVRGMLNVGLGIM